MSGYLGKYVRGRIINDERSQVAVVRLICECPLGETSSTLLRLCFGNSRD